MKRRWKSMEMNRKNSGNRVKRRRKECKDEEEKVKASRKRKRWRWTLKKIRKVKRR